MEFSSKEGRRAALLWTAAGLILLAVVIALAVSGGTRAQDASGGEDARVAQGCALVQTMRYTRCGHTVTRRLQAPEAIIGLTLQEAAQAYPDWQFQSFQSKLIEMSRDISLHCPAHYVLMPDEAGVLAIFQNRYGDGLAYVRSLTLALSELPEAEREEARVGMGFDSLEALERWLETFES